MYLTDRLIIDLKNTRLCGATLFTKEGKGWNELTPALFFKEGARRNGRVFLFE
jgi:hypothetical protein